MSFSKFGLIAVLGAALLSLAVGLPSARHKAHLDRAVSVAVGMRQHPLELLGEPSRLSIRSLSPRRVV